jgi:DNA-directed RNA polymerase specialized sigma24 family protein
MDAQPHAAGRVPGTQAGIASHILPLGDSLLIYDMKAAEFEQWIAEVFPKLYGYFFRRVQTKSDIDDLVMHCVSQIYEKHTSGSIEIYHAYLWQTAKHCLYGYWRQRGHILTRENIEGDDMSSIEHTIWVRQLIEQIKQKVSRQEYELLYEYVIENRSAAELSHARGITPAALRKRVSRLMQHLRIAIKI